MGSLHVLQHCRTYKPAEHVGQRIPGVEVRHAAGELGARVPRAHEENGTREEWRLDETKQDAHRNQLGVCFGCAAAGRNDTPEHHGRGEVEGGPEASEEQVGRQLEHQVADKEDGGRKVEVGASHAQVLLQRSLARLGEVGAVEEVEQIHEDEARQHVQVRLADQPLLEIAAPFCISTLELLDVGIERRLGLEGPVTLWRRHLLVFDCWLLGHGWLIHRKMQSEVFLPPNMRFEI